MIRFRNPGTQYNTQIQVFRELYRDYASDKSFDLDDMAETIARSNLMTSYGHAGDAALALSQNDNDSLNSTKMNAKMYAEVFRLLGWIASAGNSSYPLVFTYIGEHVATTNDVLPLYEQCVLGINNPQEIMSVKYSEKLRFFKTALITFTKLDDVMYKHELCIGPMSINDTDNNEFNGMIKNIKSIRGAYDKYLNAYSNLCSELDVKHTLPDNSTRLPIAFMKTCKWVDVERSNNLYPPKSLEILRITEKGKLLVNQLLTLKDLRLDEYKASSNIQKKSLIRLGIYSMLKRAGYDTEPVEDIIKSDSEICKNILKGKELLFSPYQTIRASEVEDALQIKRKIINKIKNKEVIKKEVKEESQLYEIILTTGTNKKINNETDKEVESYKKYVHSLNSKLKSKEKLLNEIVKSHRYDTQNEFYPFIATLFRVIGFKCNASRAGDNGARWDAIIIDQEKSVPIEIKSPTEELHISLKAIRQALENKVVLLSRQTHHTIPEVTSLAVGYEYPNDRADVTALIKDFKKTYGVKIGIIDLLSLVKITVDIILYNKSCNIDNIFNLEGYANVNIK